MINTYVTIAQEVYFDLCVLDFEPYASELARFGCWVSVLLGYSRHSHMKVKKG